MTKIDKEYFSIGDVAKILEVQQHVIRFWEGRFTAIKPIRKAGNRRYYRKEDIEFLKKVRDLLYIQGLSVKGVQNLLSKQKRHAIKVNLTASFNNAFLNPSFNSANDSSLKASPNALPNSNESLQSAKNLILEQRINTIIEELQKINNLIKQNLK